MNYRHAFHAGNEADCLKHAVLLALLDLLARKPVGFTVLDTHAGAGQYDLEADPAQRTGEWRRGIGRLLAAPPDPALAGFLEAVRAAGAYPGSPVLIRAALRPQDRLVCCELHGEDAAALRRRFAHDPCVAVHHRDGYEALGALLPPVPRRGLILIDPPYEAPDEPARVLDGLALGLRRFATGVFLVWYPVKGAALPRALHDAARARGLPETLCAELHLRAPTDAARMAGSGLLLINAPWGAEARIAPILDALRRGLGTGEPGGGTVLRRLTDEQGQACAA